MGVGPLEQAALPGSALFERLVPPMWRSEVIAVRQVGGRSLALQRFAFSCGLLVDVVYDEFGTNSYSARYCYGGLLDAMMSMCEWDGQDSPPGPWIKEKLTDEIGPASNAKVAFTCPRCLFSSSNPTDRREGYCGRCHDWTGVAMTQREPRPGAG